MTTRRWLWIGLLAGIVFAVNVVGRLVVRLGSVEDEDTQFTITMYALVAIALAMATAAVLWGRVRPGGETVADLAGAGVFGGLLSLVVGPFISGGTPNEDGITATLAQAGLFAAFAGGGALVGLCLLIMLGKDYRSKSLARFAESKLAKPRRPVRS